MSNIDPKTPVIIGQAVRITRKADLPGPEPLQAWDEVCRSAAVDAGLSADVLKQTGFLGIAHCLSWCYDDPVARLAQNLQASPKEKRYSEPSGTSGHSLLNKAIDSIRSGRSDLAVVCGGECLASLKTYLKAKQPAPWSFHHPRADEVAFNLDEYQHPGEVAIGLTADVGAIYGFAMRDVARRAHLGIEPDAYRRQLGEMLAGMTQVAATNPHAWFPEEKDAEFLITVRDDNRMVSYPYTKLMVAIIEVDLSGALILCREEKADSLGVPREKRIYPWSSCYAEDPDFIAVCYKLWKSEAMAAASQAAMSAAGITARDLSYIDLYSCFGSSVEFACDALELGDLPGDRLTVTGGLPYAGGPGSSYTLTSIPKLVEKLRKDPGSFGMASGVGMYMSHHAYSIFSSLPPNENVRPVDEKAVQEKLDAMPHRRIEEGYEGPVTLAAYTVMYGKDGQVSHGAAICDLPDGARAYARILAKDMLEEATRTEWVGKELKMVRGETVGELKRL